MAIEITEENFYLGFWHFEFPNNPPISSERGNFMGCVWRPKNQPQGPWTFRYRFRYYKDDKAFDSEDKRNWYETTGKGLDDADAKTKIDTAMTLISSVHGPVKIDFYELMCAGPAAMDKMLKKPPSFMEVREEKFK